MSAEDNSPRARPGLRLRAFLPLSEDATTFSTRGQNLPAILSSLGTPPQIARRPSSYRFLNPHDDEEAQRKSGEFDRASLDGQSYDETMEAARDRRMSTAAEILMTPQMRSQRLIGKSNPRYKWYGSRLKGHWEAADDRTKGTVFQDG
jgi:hypothetical protein